MKTLAQYDAQIAKLQAERLELHKKELAKKNLNINGYAIICLWCGKNKTIDDTSNICQTCMDKPREQGGAILKIYDKI